MKLESLALHHGYESEATTKAAAVPVTKPPHTPLMTPNTVLIYLILRLQVISIPELLTRPQRYWKNGWLQWKVVLPA